MLGISGLMSPLKLLPQQVRQMLANSDLDPNMFSALAPGAWWEVANGAALPPIQPYADEAGEAAVEAARRGALEASHCPVMGISPGEGGDQ
jgi:hypothetical protein